MDDLASYTIKKPRRAAVRYFAHANHLFSTSAVTNRTGQVIERYSYNAYGVRTVKNPAGVVLAKTTVNSDRGFTGYKLDAETGLYFSRTRMYFAKFGRFMQRDGYKYADGMNMYSFVGNNINFTDPLGTLKCATVLLVAHHERAGRTAQRTSGLSTSNTCSRLYPAGCNNASFYLPPGQTANYGSQPNTGVTEFGQVPRDPGTDSLIGKEGENLVLDAEHAEAFKSAADKLEEATANRVREKGCCDG